MPSPARGCEAVRIKLLDLCQRTQPSHSKHTQTIRRRCRRGNAGSWEILTAKSNYHRDLGEITDYPPLPCTPLLRDYIRPWARDALLLTVPFYFDCRLIVMTSLTLYIAFSTKYTIIRSPTARGLHLEYIHQPHVPDPGGCPPEQALASSRSGWAGGHDRLQGSLPHRPDPMDG